MKYIRRFATYGIFLVCLIVTVSAQSPNSKQQLIEKFRTNRSSDHKAAYEAAKEFAREFPDDTSDEAKAMKKYIVAYEITQPNSEKQNFASGTNQPPTNNPTSSGTEPPEIAEARIAITKYKDYPSAIKSLDSSTELTKRTSVWLSVMAIAQEGAGNKEEELKYLEKYNELVPGQHDTLEKLADLRYIVRKERKAIEEELRFGSLEQTKAWLIVNMPKVHSSNPNDRVTLIFEGLRMRIEELDSKKGTSRDRDEYMVISAILTDLDLNTIGIRITPESQEAAVNIGCKDNKDCISKAHYWKTLATEPRHSSSSDYFQFGQYSNLDLANQVIIALRNAIRLSQKTQ